MKLTTEANQRFVLQKNFQITGICLNNSLSDQQNIFKTHLNHKKSKPTKRQKDYEKPVKRKIKIKQIMRIVYRFINRYMCNFNK